MGGKSMEGYYLTLAAHSFPLVIIDVWALVFGLIMGPISTRSIWHIYYTLHTAILFVQRHQPNTTRGYSYIS